MKCRIYLPSTVASGVFVTIPEVAARLAIGRASAYELISKRRLPHYHIGRSVRVREDDVLAFLETVRQEATQQTTASTYVGNPAR